MRGPAGGLILLTAGMEILDSLFKGLFEVAPTYMILTDADGYVIEMNPAMLRGLGYRHAEVMGKHYPSTFIPRDFRNNVEGQFELSKTGEDRRVNVNPIIARDGSHRIIEWHGSSVKDREGEVEAICAVGVDITARISMEHHLRSAVEERGILLQELYHRTKNNLQQIESIIDITRRASSSPEVGRVLHELAGRISSMALVHEQVSRSENLSRISLDSYLRTLVPGILSSRTRQGTCVDWTLSLERDLRLEAEQMHAIGLITNEAVTNSLKYAFIGQESGSISIRGKPVGDDRYQLQIGDTGRGLPRAADTQLRRGFGMTAITGLARYELDGSAVLESESGVTWVITFPLEPATSRGR